MNLTLRQMRMFLEVARELNFTVAASQLYLTQSALTSAIAVLENEFGHRVFDRTTRRVRLTREGLMLFNHVERLLQEVDRSLRLAKAEAEGNFGRIRFSSTSAFIGYAGGAAVTCAAEKYPEVAFDFHAHSSTRVKSLILEGELDFAICSTEERVDGLISIPILQDFFGCVFLSHGADLIFNSSQEFLDVNRYIAFEEEYGFQRIIERKLFDRKSFFPRLRTANMNVLVALIRSGAGFGILPGLAARLMIGADVRFAALPGEPIFREIHLLKREGHMLSKPAQFLIREFFRQSSLNSSELVTAFALREGDIEKFLAS